MFGSNDDEESESTEEEETEEQEHDEEELPKTVRDANVPTADSVVQPLDLERLAHDTKCVRKAVGEVDGIDFTVYVSPKMEDGERSWVVGWSNTRLIEEKIRDTQYANRRKPTASTAMSGDEEYDNPTQAYHTFEKTVEEYDLDEITQPTDNLEEEE